MFGAAHMSHACIMCSSVYVSSTENAKFLTAQFLKEKEAVEKTHTRTSHRTVDTKPLIEELT